MIEMGADAIFKIVAYVVITLLFGVAGHSVLRRRVSKDKLALASDEGHVDILGVLRQERAQLIDRLDKLTQERDDALREHSQAMLEIGSLRQEVRYMTSRISEQSKQILQQSVKIETLEKTIEALTNQIKSLLGMRDLGIPPTPKD
jgi:peptidoglycan hydrolase CwlO-like protein